MTTGIWGKTWTCEDAPPEILMLALTNDGFAPKTLIAVKQHDGNEALAVILYKKEHPNQLDTDDTGEYRVKWLSPPPSSPFTNAIFPGFGKPWEPSEGVIPAKPDPKFTYWGLTIWGEWRVVMYGAIINLNTEHLQIIRGLLRQDITGFSKFSNGAI